MSCGIYDCKGFSPLFHLSPYFQALFFSSCASNLFRFLKSALFKCIQQPPEEGTKCLVRQGSHLAPTHGFTLSQQMNFVCIFMKVGGRELSPSHGEQLLCLYVRSSIFSFGESFFFLAASIGCTPYSRAVINLPLSTIEQSSSYGLENTCGIEMCMIFLILSDSQVPFLSSFQSAWLFRRIHLEKRISFVFSILLFSMCPCVERVLILATR